MAAVLSGAAEEHSVKENTAGEALWRFALALYARSGVAELLLRLQDRDGSDVSLVLFLLWRGANGCLVDAAELAMAAALAEPVGKALVGPLRRLRGDLKVASNPDLQALRRRVLALELAAEHAILRGLAANSAESSGAPEPDRTAAARSNLGLYLRVGAESPELAPLFEALTSLMRLR